MKKLIYAILDNHHTGEEVINALTKANYNGSLFPSTSFKHSLENGGEIPMFINLSHFESDRFENNTTINIVVDEEDVKEVTEIINKVTNEFKKCRGGLFVLPIESYQGTF